MNACSVVLFDNMASRGRQWLTVLVQKNPNNVEFCVDFVCCCSVTAVD